MRALAAGRPPHPPAAFDLDEAEQTLNHLFGLDGPGDGSEGPEAGPAPASDDDNAEER